jgi:CAAX prenyl protease-like protein
MANRGKSAGNRESLDLPPGSATLLSHFANNPWLVFALPLAVFMAVGALEPTPDKPFELLGISIDYSSYPIVYLVKMVLTMVAIALVWPGYRQFPWRLSALAPVVGLVGGVIWIGLCKLGLESRLFSALDFGWLTDGGARSAFNPLDHWRDRPALAYSFLALRLWGLAVIVPVIEEFFLRGLVMRYFLAHEWWKVPIGVISPTAILAGTLVPIAMHPLSELLAVIVWFSMVTWLMVKTRNIWDCVAAHAVTNAMIGAWVLYSGDWFLW